MLGLGQLAFALQVVDELGVVHDLDVFPTVVLVLLAQRVEAVGAGGDDLLHPDFLKGGKVGLGQHLEQVFVAGPTSGVPAAPFLHAQNADIKAGFLHDADGVTGDLLVAFVKRGGASSEVDVFGRLGDLDVQPFGPVASLMGRQAVGV